MFKKRLIIAAPFLWAAIVFVLHVIPIKPEAEPNFKIPHADKIVHFSMFFALAFLTYRAVKAILSNRPGVKRVALIALFCLSYGAMMELIQGTFFIDRDSDVFDWCADAIGTFSGLWLASTSFLTSLFNTELRK